LSNFERVIHATSCRFERRTVGQPDGGDNARVIRNLVILLASAIALAAFALPAQASTPFDCKRVIPPAEWRAVLGTSITVRHLDNANECQWSHGRPSSGGVEGLLFGYPMKYREWHEQYVMDKTRNRALFPCGEDRQTRRMLRTFGGEFAWSSEHKFYVVPEQGSGCAGVKALTSIDRTVYVVHHGRLLWVNSNDSYLKPPVTGASFAQLERFAHMAIRRF